MAIAASYTEARSAPKGMIPASFMLGGIVLAVVGLTWDIQWHTDVGPDTFFTLPHLFLYSGNAISGLTSLTVVLMTTAASRRGKTVDPVVGGRTVAVFGRTFAAPVGYLIAGSGVALFLLYGLWDQWWHTLYGFDAVIQSPPHIGLLLSSTITMVGVIMVFAVARDQRWGRFGTIAGAAVLLTFSMVTVIGLQAFPRGIIHAVNAGTAFVSVLLVMVGARALDRRGGAVGVAAVVALLQAAFWWFSPWVTRVYADATGLPVRDYTDGVPQMPSLVPMCLLIVAVVVEITRGWPAPVVGAIGGLIVTACAPLQHVLVYGGSLPRTSSFVATVVVGAILGALAGLLGNRFGQMLRHLALAKETSAKGTNNA